MPEDLPTPKKSLKQLEKENSKSLNWIGFMLVKIKEKIAADEKWGRFHFSHPFSILENADLIVIK